MKQRFFVMGSILLLMGCVFGSFGKVKAEEISAQVNKNTYNTESTESQASKETTEIKVEGMEFTNILDNQLVMTKGTKQLVKAKVLPADKVNQKYFITTSDEDVVVVNTNGELVAKGYGTARVRFASAEDENVSISIRVKVVKKKYKVTRIYLKATNKTIKVNNYYMLKAYVKPKKATVKKVKFSSSNKRVATVSKKGKIKGVSPGTAVITVSATDGSGVEANCYVTVE